MKVRIQRILVIWHEVENVCPVRQKTVTFTEKKRKRNKKDGVQINENSKLTKSSSLMIFIYYFFLFFFDTTLFKKRTEKCKELLNDNHHNFYSTAAIHKRKREKQVRTIYHVCNWIQAFPHESTQHCVAVTAAVTGVDRMCPDYKYVIPV